MIRNVTFDVVKPSSIEHVNPHASNGPFCTALLMYFSILSLCHVGDHGLTYDSLLAGYAAGNVWEDVGFLSWKGESEMFLFVLYYAIVSVLTFYSYFKIDEVRLSTFFRTLYEQYGRLDGSEAALERDTEYSDALIRDYVQRQATFHPVQLDPVGESVEEDRTEIRKAYPALLVFHVLFFAYASLNLLDNEMLDSVGGLSTLSSCFEPFDMPELAGKELGVYLSEGVWLQLMGTVNHSELAHSLYFFSSLQAEGYFSPQSGSVADLAGLQSELVRQDVFVSMYVFDIGGELVEQGDFSLDAYTQTGLFHSKLFMLLGLSVLVFLCGTYNGIYVLSTSDDSYMNKELNRIGHFRVEENVWFGFTLFLLSEVLIFAGFFWALFFYMLVPSVELGATWMPAGLEALMTDLAGIPLMNTYLLLASAWAITWGHDALSELTFGLKRRSFVSFDR